MYSEKVMDHFANPRNVGIIEDANVVVRVGDPGCGDGLLIFIKIESDRVADIKYKIYGCGAAIATSSVASESRRQCPPPEAAPVRIMAPPGSGLRNPGRWKERCSSACSTYDTKSWSCPARGEWGRVPRPVNLALALAMQDQAVGILDVDLHGPSVPKMLGVEGQRPKMPGDAMLPVNALGLKVMFLGFMLGNPHDAVIWRGAMKHGVIRQLIGDVAWGYLDYLVVDCPPGTGDEPFSVAQTLGEGACAIIVTTPQDMAILDVRRSIGFCRQLQIPILGIVENMSGFACPGCGQVHHIFKEGGGVTLAAETGVPFLGAIPLEPTLTAAGDSGRPCLITHPDGPIAHAFSDLALRVLGPQQAG